MRVPEVPGKTPIKEPKPNQAARSDYGSVAQRLRSGLAQRIKRVKLASRVILVGLLISFGGIMWLNQTATMVALGYNMQAVDKQVDLLNRQAEALQSQVASFENLQRIEDEAKGKLGMVPATKFVYLKVQATGEATDAGRANGKLYPVNDWWRELTEMLPKPWQHSAPASK